MTNPRSKPRTSATFQAAGPKWSTMNGSHRNHYAHQALQNQWRDTALAFAHPLFQVRGQVASPVVITATVHRVRNGRADAHNVTPTIKACIDGAVRAGLLVDDSDEHVTELRIRAGEKRPQPTVTLLIEHAEAVAS